MKPNRGILSAALAAAAFGAVAAFGGYLIGQGQMKIYPLADPVAASGAPVVGQAADADEIADLRGRIVALENAAEKTATSIEKIVAKLPPEPPSAEEVVKRVLLLEQDVGDVALPYHESKGATSQPPLFVLTDPRCPFCRGGHPTTAALAAEGKARVVYMPIGLLGPDSVKGAVAVLAMATLDGAAAASLLDDIYALPRLADAKDIEAAVTTVLGKSGRTQAEFDAAIPAGEAAHARIEKAYRARSVNSGVPVYVRSVDGQLRGKLGFEPDGSGDEKLRKQLGF